MRTLTGLLLHRSFLHAGLPGLVALALTAAAAHAFADEPPPPPPPAPLPAAPTLPPPAGYDPAVQQRLADLEQQVRVLARQHELAREELGEERKSRPVVRIAPGQGFSIATADRRFSLDIRARAVVRNTFTDDAKGPANEINVKTLRLYFTGNVLAPDLRYVIQLALGTNDFEAGNPSPIFDAFIDWSRWKDANLRVGQFFVPFDRARTIREFALQFVDRQAVVTELSLDRDVGISVYSNDLGRSRGTVGYALGIFGGEGKNRFGGTSPGFLYVGRLVFRPFGYFDDEIEGDLGRLPYPRLAIGLGGAFNQAAQRQRSTTGNFYTLGGYDYVHGDADVVFKYAGFSFLGELLVRRALWNNRSGTDANMQPLTEWSRSGWGYLLQAGYMVDKRVEVVARWEQLVAWAPTDPALAKSVTDGGHQAGAGLNVYLNGHYFKVQTDYFYVFGDVADKGRHQWRVQLDAMF